MLVEHYFGFSTNNVWSSPQSYCDHEEYERIGLADKGSAVVNWDRVDYIKEAKKQLNDKKLNKNINFKIKIYQN